MNEQTFKYLVMGVGLAFAAFFCVTIIPELIAEPAVIAAFAAGFVNPYAAGYSTDVILCWVILTLWVVYERAQFGVRGGWICVLLGIVPGVAVGFALYLVMRLSQLKTVRV